MFPESQVARIQGFLEFIWQGNPISEETTEKKSFVLSWCTWCLGGSYSSFGRRQGLFSEATKKG